MEQKLKEQLLKLLKEHHDSLQNRPNQYVVEIRRTSDNSFYGYHVSTMTEVSEDIFDAKRYAGLEPDGQLRTIHNNIVTTLNYTEEKAQKIPILGPIILRVKDLYWKGMTPADFYLDAVYLSEDMPRKTMNFQIVDL